MTDIQKRIDLLRKKMPGSDVGIMIQLDDGWEASLPGKEPVQFTSERDARNYLEQCKTVIIIDV